MKKQTDDFIDENIVRILNKRGESLGSGFFVNKDYCVTCHHNICELDEIYVGKLKSEMYPAGWSEEYSDPHIDLAVLRVKDSPYSPLECGTYVYPKLNAVVMGFPYAGRDGNLSCDQRKGVLGLREERFILPERQIKGSKKYNVKPDAIIKGYTIQSTENDDGGFQTGLSGSPVCFEHGLTVIGMLVAEQDTKTGYMLPITVILEKFKKEEKSAISPSDTIDAKKIIEKGNEYYSKDEYEKAVSEYDKVLNDPNYLKVWVNKGYALGRLGKHEQAIACYDRALEIDPINAHAWYSKGNQLYEIGQYDRAIACYDEAIKIDPNSSVYYTFKAFPLRSLNRYDEAMTCHDRAIEINPDPFDWYARGRTFLEMHEYDEALGCFNKAIEINPKYEFGWSGKADTLDAMQLYDEALKCFDRAIEINPVADYNWDDKGGTLKKMGRVDEAEYCFRKARELRNES